jgi:hypothetical protein
VLQGRDSSCGCKCLPQEASVAKSGQTSSAPRDQIGNSSMISSRGAGLMPCLRGHPRANERAGAEAPSHWLHRQPRGRQIEVLRTPVVIIKGSRVRVPPFPPLCKLLIPNYFLHLALRSPGSRIDTLDELSTEFGDAALAIGVLGLCSDVPVGVTPRMAARRATCSRTPAALHACRSGRPAAPQGFRLEWQSQKLR